MAKCPCLTTGYVELNLEGNVALCCPSYAGWLRLRGRKECSDHLVLIMVQYIRKHGVKCHLSFFRIMSKEFL